jgi:hypothetical protein
MELSGLGRHAILFASDAVGGGAGTGYGGAVMSITSTTSSLDANTDGVSFVTYGRESVSHRCKDMKADEYCIVASRERGKFKGDEQGKEYVENSLTKTRAAAGRDRGRGTISKREKVNALLALYQKRELPVLSGKLTSDLL